MVNSTQGLKYSCFAKERIKIKAFSMKMKGLFLLTAEGKIKIKLR